MFRAWCESTLVVIEVDYLTASTPIGAAPSVPPLLTKETFPTPVIHCSTNYRTGHMEPAADLEPVIPPALELDQLARRHTGVPCQAMGDLPVPHINPVVLVHADREISAPAAPVSAGGRIAYTNTHGGRMQCRIDTDPSFGILNDTGAREKGQGREAQ